MDQLARSGTLRARGPKRTVRYGSTCLLVALAVVYGVIVGGPGSASASTWTVHLSGGAGQARAQTSPAAPTGVAAACTSANLATVKVTWSAATHATNYAVYQSTTSSSSGYAQVTTTAATSWTTATLSSGNYWYEVTVSVGSNWTSAKSSATVQRIISSGPHCA